MTNNIKEEILGETKGKFWDDWLTFCCENPQYLSEVYLPVHVIETIKQFIIIKILPSILDKYANAKLEEVRELISCKKCNGQGGYLGASLGYAECEDCGGDGHCLYERDSEKIDDIINNLKTK